MLPLAELEQWYWGLEQRREFRQSMGELMKIVGVEGGEEVDLTAMLWPIGDRDGEKDTIFIFGERGRVETCFGIRARRTEDGRLGWRSLVIAHKEGSRGEVTIGGVGGEPEPMVVELGDKVAYDLEKWRVDLLVDMGWAPRLAIVKTILAGERY